MKRRLFSSIRSQVWLLLLSTVLVVLVLWGAFYQASSRLIGKNTSSFVHSLLEQSAENIRHTADEMMYVANTIATNKTVQDFLLASIPLQRLAYGRTLSNFMMGLLQYSDYVAHINIVGLNSSIISPSQQNITVIDFLSETYQAFDADVFFTGFTRRKYNNYDGIHYFTYICPIFHTQSGAKLGTKIGTCVVFCNVSNLSRFLTQSATTENTVSILLDENRNMIASNATDAQMIDALNAHTEPEENGWASATQTISINKRDYIVAQHAIEGMNWRLLSAVPLSEITNDLDPLIRLGSLTCILFALLAMLWGFQINHAITSPLVSLTNFIDNDLDEDLTRRVPITRNNEIGMLCEQFNTMLDKVSGMTSVLIANQANMYELNLAKKRAELSALQSQINPHFLYNTLDCIKGYGYLLKSEEIVKITNALTSIMRYCIKGSDMVQLKSELEIVSHYLEIMGIRFEGRFDFGVDIDPEMLDAYIPRFILQPIIENAVYHGLEPKLSHGTLHINGRIDQARDIVLCVADDGVGMSEAVLSRVREQIQLTDLSKTLSTAEDRGLALINIHSRIRGIYGEGYGLSVFSVLGERTEVVLRMPYRLLPNQLPQF